MPWHIMNSRLVDVFEGIEDMQRKVIRCVGNPKERFGEDALRMMRAIRFSAQLGFEIEEETYRAVEELAPTLEKSAWSVYRWNW